MKKVFIILAIILSMFLESCNDDFNINVPYEDVYVLNCIIRNNNSIQYAIISKNKYTENGTTPALGSTDQNIKNADINIYYNDSVFVMKDTTIMVTNSGSETQVDCYYTKDLVLKPGKIITIEASLPNGKVLRSTIKAPEISFSKFQISFPQLLKSGYNTKPYYSWNYVCDAEDILNLPQLEIYYKKYEDGIYVDKKMLVPLVLYYQYDEYGKLVPIYVDFSFNNYCLTTLETINNTMQEISGDDPHKNNYIIKKVLFSIISLDPNLTKYYSAYYTYAQDFTIKLRQTDFSNVEGGKGIFGVYYKSSLSLVVDSLYIRSFGYQYNPR